MRFQRLRHRTRWAFRPGRRVMAAGFAVLAATSLASCGEQHKSLPQPEQGTLHIGVQSLIDDAPMFIAQSKKLFAEHGLQVRLVRQDSNAEALKSLKSGEIDVSFASDVSLFKAAATGTPLRIVGEAYQAGHTTMGLAVPQQLQYVDDPSQLPPVTVAVNEPSALGTLVSNSTLSTLGLPADHINFKTVPFEKMADAIASHKVTGAWMEEPYLTQIQRKLGLFVIDTDQGGQLNMPLSAYATTPDFAENNPNTIRIFRTVLSQAQRIASDRREVQKVLPQYTGVDPTTAALVSIGTFPTSLSAIRLQRVADRMQSTGMLDTRLDVQKLIPQRLR